MAHAVESSAILSAAKGRSRNLRHMIGRQRTATALIGGLAATILLATPAAAQETSGGNGGLGNVAPGPVGGTSSQTGTGGAGGSATESYEGGAGGGAGRIGGQGGDTFTGVAGGAGGATPGAQGADGTGGGAGSRATGGGGGAHGAVLNSMAFLGGAITGGRGGNGGTSNDGDGGGGGAGGYGVVINANTASTFSFSVAITGGAGGPGGNGYFRGGGGGDGGHGLVFATAASAELNAPVTGGNAGFGGTFLAAGCCVRGGNGTGGIGVVGRDATLTINAAVSGGLNGDGLTRALALSLGGTSRLTLGSGWSLDGGIRILDGSLNFLQDNNLTLGTAVSGLGMLIKSGAGTLTLSGANSYSGGTRVEAGTLDLLAGGSLAGAVVNDAAFNNAGTVTGLVTNNSTMTSTGRLRGGLSNNGLASISGVVDGDVLNTTNGTIILTGATTSIHAVTQTGNGTFNLNGFDTVFISLTGTGKVMLGSATLTVSDFLSQTSNTTFGGVISGSGGLTLGFGSLKLTGTNTYTGPTEIEYGTLELSATGSIAGEVQNYGTFNNAGTVAGYVYNYGTLANTGTLSRGLDNHGHVSLSGTVTGSVSNYGVIDIASPNMVLANLTLRELGSLNLNGHDTYIGGLYTNYPDAFPGMSTVNLDGGTLTLSSGFFNGRITGNGALIKTGTGGLAINGDTDYTGPTTVAGGSLRLQGNVTGDALVLNQASLNLAGIGTITGNVLNQGTFQLYGLVTGMVENDGTLINYGTIAGGLLNNGDATLWDSTIDTGVVNNGTITFNNYAREDRNTITALQQGATGAIIVNARFNQLASIGTLTGSGTITLTQGTLTIGTGNGNSSFAGTISGAGSLTKTGTGTLVLTGAATHTGGTTISGGALQIGTGGTTGSLSGAVTNNGLLVLNRSDAVTLANVMSGTGGFVQAGSGTTTLTGANSYIGGTRVSAGRLRGDTTSLQGDILIDSALEFAQTGAGTYAGSLSGAGTFEKTGIGALNLTGNSSTFTGATSVIAGQMAINGLLSHSTVTVHNGATVGGTGMVGGLVVQNGGAIAPGNSVGTFNVAGNVLFQAGSLFAAEVQASGADKIQATGTAQLNGALQVIDLGGNYGINSTFVLLHADGGVSGTFTTTNLTSFGLAYRPKIIYTANEVQLLLAPNQLSAVLGTGVPLTYNQASTIGRIDAAVMTGGYDPVALSALYNLAPAAIPAALDQLSGEIYADATRAALEDERVVREAVIGRLAEAADTGLTGNGAWGQVIDSWGSVDSDGNAAGYDVNRTGMLMGLDAGGASDDGSWRAGVMGHYTRIIVPADARGSRATIDRTGGGFYAGAAIGGLRFRTGATLSLLDLKARRNIAIPGLTTTERGETTGVMFQTFAELSYRIEMGKDAFLEPYLAGSVSRVRFGRFSEGSGSVSLSVAEEKDVLGIAELGLRGDVPLGVSAVRLGGNIGLRSAFGDRTANPIIALTAASNQAFNVRSAEIDHLAAAANLHLTADLSDTLSLRVGYTGVLSSGAREHGARATLSLTF